MRTIDRGMTTTSSPDKRFAEMIIEQVTVNLNSVGFHQEGTPQRKLDKSELDNRSPEWDIITFVHPKKNDKIKVHVRDGHVITVQVDRGMKQDNAWLNLRDMTELTRHFGFSADGF